MARGLELIRQVALRAAVVAAMCCLGALVGVETASADARVTWDGPMQCGQAATETAPAGAISMTVAMVGGQGGMGGGSGGGAGGLGGDVLASFAVGGGQAITAVVGCQGADAPQGAGIVATGGAGGAGWSSGGNGGNGQYCGAICNDLGIATGDDGSGGGGGGSTGLCLGTGCGSSPTQLTQHGVNEAPSPNLLAVAGGGGGGGETMCALQFGGAGGAGGVGNSQSDLTNLGRGPDGAHGAVGALLGDPGGAGGSNVTSPPENSAFGREGMVGQLFSFDVSAGNGGGGAGLVGGTGGSYASSTQEAIACGAGGGGGGGSSWANGSAQSPSFPTPSRRGDGAIVVTFTVVSTPPTATISRPASGGIYQLGQTVATTFGCAEGTGGPGLASCKDSNGATGGTGSLSGLDGSHDVGPDQYTVTATSKDGLTATASISYDIVTPTTLAVTSSASPSAAAQPVTFTATLEMGQIGHVYQELTGNVTFSAEDRSTHEVTDLGSQAISVQTYIGMPPIHATVTTSALTDPAGYVITAAYSGDSENGASSGTLNQGVSAAPPAITTQSLPQATVGRPYSAQLAATGGTPSYMWNVDPSGLPPGIIFESTGQITGTPTQAGTYQLNVIVTDESSPQQRTTAQLVLTIVAPVTGTGSGATSASTGGVTATGSGGSGTLTVATYGANPGGAPTFNASGVYFDVKTAPGSSYTGLTVTDCSLAGGTAVFWWDGSSWLPVFPQTYEASTRCVSFTLSASSSPTLSQLTATPFAVSTEPTVSVALSPTPNGSGWNSAEVTLALTGGTGTASITYSAIGAQTIAATTARGTSVTLTVSAEGTTTITADASDVNGVAGPTAIQIVQIDETPPATTAAAGGYTFGRWSQQSVTLTLSATDQASGSGMAATYYALDGGSQQSYAAPFAIGTDGDHTVSYWSVDNAGNAEAPHSVHVLVDRTPPVITPDSSLNSCDKPGSNGWCRGTETAGFTASDPTPGSGLANAAQASFTQSTLTNGSAVTVPSVPVCDLAGNCNRGISAGPFKIDGVPPAAPTFSFSPDGTSGWFETAPATGTVTSADATSGVSLIVCTDNGSPLAVGSGGTLSLSGDGSHAVSCTATDNAGNAGAAGSTTVKIDTTPPQVTAAAAPAPNAAGWNNTAVNVTASGTDAASGIAACTTQTLSADGANQPATVSCTDNAGNSASVTVSAINVDRTPPTITGSRTPAANRYGWNNGSVTVSFTCGDNLSGVAGCSGPTTLSAEGQGQSVTGTATDKAGNTASATVSGISVDLTPPSLHIAGPSIVLGGTTATATVTASDALSGLASDPSGTVTLDAGSPGTHTLTRTATDKAGNSASATFTYTVWGVNGRFPPVVKNGNSSGQFKAGSTIPVKFQLTDGTGLVNSATGTVTIGGSSAAFAWDGGAQRYQAEVKTDKAAAGSQPVVLNVTGVGSLTIATVNLK